MKLINLAGKKVGRWTVLRRDYERGSTATTFALTYWICLCECGTVKSVRASSLQRGKSKSCGCYLEDYRNAMVTHGLTGTPEYRTWMNMLNRCRNPNVPGFEHYGGRGITVCDRWQRFENFFSDMGPRPSKQHSIDRIDVNGPYAPSNCKWSTALEQVTNRRKIGCLAQFSTEELLGELDRRNCKWASRKEQANNRHNSTKHY